MNWIAFVGEGRSGHTIVSAILGSHPNARVSEEQKYISKWYREHWTREQIFQHLLQSGIGRTRKSLGFSGILEHKEPLQLVGDKCGWDAVNEYKKREAPKSILSDFEKFINISVKTIVTLRHPLDNISAWVVSPKYKRMYSDDNLRFRRMIRRYKRFYDAVLDILEGQDTYYLYNEILIAEPEKTVIDLANWLELPIEDKWLIMCCERIFKKAHQRRDELNWPKEYKKRVFDYIDSCPLLEYYR